MTGGRKRLSRRARGEPRPPSDAANPACNTSAGLVSKPRAGDFDLVQLERDPPPAQSLPASEVSAADSSARERPVIDSRREHAGGLASGLPSDSSTRDSIRTRQTRAPLDPES